jgi:crossover junction endodeoxyribonuclease RuvC
MTVIEPPARERAESCVCPAYALGVDIGVHGHIAGLDKSGGLLWLHAMPVTRETSGRSAINAALLSGVLAAAQCSVAFVEFVAARPTDSRVGAFGFGRSRGVIEGVCGGLSIPIIWVAPSTWKRAANIPAGREHKDLCRTRAIAKWPSFAESFRRKSDCDAAEAALICWAGLQKHLSP